jgi:hypothetical protein
MDKRAGFAGAIASRELKCRELRGFVSSEAIGARLCCRI